MTLDEFKSFFEKDFGYYSNSINIKKDDVITFSGMDSITFQAVDSEDKISIDSGYIAIDNGIIDFVSNTSLLITSEIKINDIVVWNDYYNSIMISDSDIEKAIREANAVFVDFFGQNEDDKNLAFMYLVAFFLWNDIQASNNGGQVSLLSGSRSVGSVSISNSIPAYMLSNPRYAFYNTNYYGQKYLMLCQKYVLGTYFGVVRGATLP